MSSQSTELGARPSRAVARGSYVIARSLFLRLLGFVYLIAFISLWLQVEGLIGVDGVLPVTEYLDSVRERVGGERYWLVPTLLWLNSTDVALHLLCGTGTVLAIALLAGCAPFPVLFLLWSCYLSLVQGGQVFLGFQWDTLLLETGLCALFLAPFKRRLPLRDEGVVPDRAALWLMWLLLFKLMFLSGAVKPLSMDETWWQLTALDYHYWTQPLPNAVSWHAAQLPSWFQQLSVLLTYALEMVLPLLIFTGRLGRRLVAVGTVFLMVMISLTGNYGFFNLLTMVLCVLLVDDAVWARWLPLGRAMPGSKPATASILSPVRRFVAAVAVALIMSISAASFLRELVRTIPPNTARDSEVVSAARTWASSWINSSVLRWVAPFRSINGYGLFRAMTTERPEIVLEGSVDGRTWTAYEFAWKPGDPARRPRMVAPHMPRLDWQMWFAALDPNRAQHWLVGLMRGALRGSDDIMRLLDRNPFVDQPPRFVRLVKYQYHFATAEQKREHGVWWQRELIGPLTPPLTIEQLEVRE